MKTAKQILIAARQLIESPEQWIQGALYQPGDKCCSVGAVFSASKAVEDHDQCERAFAALEIGIPSGGFSYFNDTHTHAEVLAKFDEAIASL